VCAACWYDLAWACLHQGDLRQALHALNESLHLVPNAVPALSTRALVHTRLGRYPQALCDISRAIEIRPGREADLHNRGVVLTALGRHREAVDDYRRVLSIRPDSAGTHNNLAWLLATCPEDPKPCIPHPAESVPQWHDLRRMAVPGSGTHANESPDGLAAPT